MSYPKYTVPPVSGATLQLAGAPATPVQSNDQRFCTFEDAKVILKAFTDAGLPDGSLLDASVATINGEHFFGVDPNSPARPWYIQSAQIQGPVGPLVWMIYGPNPINGGGRGNPGTLTGLLTGNPRYTPTPAPSVISLPPQVVDHSGDVAAFPGTQVAQQASDQDARIKNIERLVIAMAATINIK